MHKEHSVDWYWGLGVIATLGALVSVWVGNPLFAIIIIISAASLGMLVARGPREHQVHIDNRGVAIDGTLYPFRSLQSFWVDDNPDNPRLYLMTTGIFAPHITLPLDNASQAGQVHSVLRRVVAEVEQAPHFGEHVANLLGL